MAWLDNQTLTVTEVLCYRLIPGELSCNVGFMG